MTILSWTGTRHKEWTALRGVKKTRMTPISAFKELKNEVDRGGSKAYLCSFRAWGWWGRMLLTRHKDSCKSQEPHRDGIKDCSSSWGKGKAEVTATVEDFMEDMFQSWSLKGEKTCTSQQDRFSCGEMAWVQPSEAKMCEAQEGNILTRVKNFHGAAGWEKS